MNRFPINLLWYACVISGPPNIILVDGTRLQSENALLNPSSVLQIIWSLSLIIVGVIIVRSKNKECNQTPKDHVPKVMSLGIMLLLASFAMSQISAISPLISLYRGLESVAIIYLMHRHKASILTIYRLWLVLCTAVLIRVVLIVPITFWDPQIGGIGSMAFYRFAGQIYGPNGNGILLSLTIILSFALLVSDQHSKKTYLVLFALIVLLLLTRSRTAIIATIFSVCALMFSTRIKWNPYVALPAIIGIIVVPLLIDPVEFLGAGKTGDAAMQSVLTLSERTTAWDASLAAIADEPVLGYGYVAGQRALDEHINIESPWIPGHAHNDVIQAWLCLGLGGLVGVCIIYVLIVYSSIKDSLWSKGTKPRILAPCLLLPFIAYGMMTPFFVAPLQASGALAWAILFFTVYGGYSNGNAHIFNRTCNQKMLDT